MNSDRLELFVSCTRYLESVVKVELEELGALEVKESQAGVSCVGSLETAYKIVLWSRAASRLYLKLASFEVESGDDIYRAASQSVTWESHFSPDETFAVDAFTARSCIKHSNYGALRVKDAVADYFKECCGRRPSVDPANPDIRLYLHVERTRGNLYLDLSGGSMHRRGYRLDKNEAPLRENIAAAMLLRAGWKELAAKGGSFLDPMCGSGTIAIEAALIATDTAPGLLRETTGFLKWTQHEDELWQNLLAQARDRREEGMQRAAPIYASDKDSNSVRAARQNVNRAGLSALVKVNCFDFRKIDPEALERANGGLIAINPPYGKRLGSIEEAKRLYRDLGKWMIDNFKGFRAVILTGDKELSRHTGLRALKVNTFYNGNIKSSLATFELTEDNSFREYEPEKKFTTLGEDKTTGLNMIVSRLKKNKRGLKAFLKREGLTCYRIYDADIPQYSAAIDIYLTDKGETHVVVQEYAAPSTIEEKVAEERFKEIVGAIPHFMEVKQENIHIKQRRRQKGSNQYNKVDESRNYHTVSENGLNFLVNFKDYLDTGLFLDHRITRFKLRQMAAGKSFLNLYAYTCTATMYAIAGGARETVSVDTSNTYLKWGERNLKANNYNPGPHKFVRRDCMEFLKEDRTKYDLIFIDPPTFSNRKGREAVFDVQRDHRELIELAAARLTPGGVIVFSNNYRKFKMDPELEQSFAISDISLSTIPEDFKRNQKIHRTWIISSL